MNSKLVSKFTSFCRVDKVLQIHFCLRWLDLLNLLFWYHWRSNFEWTFCMNGWMKYIENADYTDYPLLFSSICKSAYHPDLIAFSSHLNLHHFAWCTKTHTRISRCRLQIPNIFLSLLQTLRLMHKFRLLVAAHWATWKFCGSIKIYGKSSVEPSINFCPLSYWVKCDFQAGLRLFDMASKLCTLDQNIFQEFLMYCGEGCFAAYPLLLFTIVKNCDVFSNTSQFNLDVSILLLLTNRYNKGILLHFCLPFWMQQPIAWWR